MQIVNVFDWYLDTQSLMVQRDRSLGKGSQPVQPLIKVNDLEIEDLVLTKRYL
jgi:hypothetical protein